MKKSLKNLYLKNPCGTLSIPFWKNKITKITDDIIIIYHKDFKNQYNDYQMFFRLSHNLNMINTPICKVEEINLNDDKLKLVNMINICYKEQRISIDESDILSWINHPSYNPKLWVKIEVDGLLVASGIAEFDEECKEGILEWIQVLPEFRKKGYGEVIVNSLLSELKKIGADFATVSGNVENECNSERLYRKCGFVGDDIWYICKIK